jgi:hypothetical protein
VGARAATFEKAIGQSQETSDRSQRMKRILVVAIGALLVVNLVLLVILGNTVGLL